MIEATHYFSPSQKGFYPAALKARYKEAGTWPDDAIALTDEQYQTFGTQEAGRPKGKTLGTDEQGRPCWVDEAPLPIEQQRQAALDAIDAAADKARAADRSIGQYLDAEYRLVQAALEQWRTRDSDDAPVPLAIQDWADAQGITPDEAAEQIAEAAGKTEDRLLEIRRIRLAGKATVRGAEDEADFTEIAKSFIDSLKALFAE